MPAVAARRRPSEYVVDAQSSPSAENMPCKQPNPLESGEECRKQNAADRADVIIVDPIPRQRATLWWKLVHGDEPPPL